MKRLALLAIPTLALAAGLVFWQAQTPRTATPDFNFGAANAQEADTSAIVDMALGDPGASVTVIEYASFTCPHCASFHAGVFKELKKNYIDTGKVRFIHREVFFDRFGLWGSIVARCGGEMRYFAIADLIYKQQREWTQGGPAAIADNLRRIGRSAGLSDDELNACLQDGDNAQALFAWYQKNAEADGIRSTPSFVIDGESYSNMNYQDFSEVLDAKLGG